MVFDIYTRLTYTCFQEIASECKKHIHEAFPVYSLQVHANDTNNSNFLLWIPNQKVIITFHQTVLQLASVHWKPHLLTWFDIIRVMSVKHPKVSFRKTYPASIASRHRPAYIIQAESHSPGSTHSFVLSKLT